MGREASRTRIEARVVELGGRLVEAQAPAHWTAARLDAWMDWAARRTDRASDIPAAIADYVEELTGRAQAKGLVKDVRARTRFRDALTEALLAGTLAIGGTMGNRATPVIEAGSAELAPALTRLTAIHRGRAAAAAAADGLGRRLQSVMDAILRCDGDAEACADPRANPSLARAADAARTAGAPDELILEAIALARDGEITWDAEAPAAEPA